MSLPLSVPRFVLIGVLVLSVGVFGARGHEGPSEAIRRLSAEIDAGRGTAEIYLARAIEYRILNKASRAARDLSIAAKSAPELVSVWRESAQVYLDLENPTLAVKAARRAVAACNPDSREAMVCHVLLAEILGEVGFAEEALKVIAHTFSKWPVQGVEIYWQKASLLAQIGHDEQREKCLLSGWKETGSEALRIAWIESCIDLGRGREVLNLIDQGIRTARFKAAWRLRRAEVMISLQSVLEAERELVAAISELDQRSNPQNPCREIVAERKLALSLLNDLGSERRFAPN